MNKILKILFFIFIFSCIVFSAWYVLFQDIEYTSEIARDFLLLNELATKKIILIGPSSTTGLFHGPLWSYLNLPAYLAGNGNPVVIGWGWVVLIAIYTISSFYIAKNLFNTKTAYFFTIMIAVYSIFHARGLYNPHGAMFVIPALFFFFVKYIETLKSKYLIFHALFLGALIQFQMAIGIPFFILSILCILVTVIKRRKLSHLLFFLIVPLMLSNYVIFDLRHDFLNLKLIMKFILEGKGELQLLSQLEQRARFMSYGVEFLRQNKYNLNLYIFLIFCLYLYFQIKDKKYLTVYFSFLYFYLGYFVLSNLNSGGLLYFYLFPLFPLVFLIFSSFVTARFSKIFILIFFLILVLNLQSVYYDLSNRVAFASYSENSWKLTKSIVSKSFSGKEKDFGFFIYSPDVLGYRAKYAMRYVAKLHDKNAHYFKKRPITYLIVSPPFAGNPYMKDEWWRINLIHIKKKPVKVFTFPNGYKVEKYNLTKEEVATPVEPNIDPGLTFR